MTKSTKTRFHGIIPPVSTLFHPDGSFDRVQQAKLIDNMIAGGVHGLFFLGSNGEAAHMPVEQRFEVAEFCIGHVAGRVPVLIGISVPGTAGSIAIGQHAARHGADGVVAINPYYARLDEKSLYGYFRDVADAVPVPMMLYNFPGVTGQDLSPELVLHLARDCPSIVGLKDTVDTLSHIRRAIQLIKPARPDFLIFAGFEEYMLETLIMGGDGCVPASGNFAPQISIGVYEAFRAGDYAALLGWQRKLVHIPPLYALESPFYSVIKQAMKMVGFADAATVLPPVLEASPESIATIRRTLVQIGVLADDGAGTPT